MLQLPQATHKMGPLAQRAAEHMDAVTTSVEISSLVDWRPAEDVVPVDAPPVLADAEGEKDIRFCGCVYVRRTRAQVQKDKMNPPRPASPSQTDLFTSKVNKTLQSTLPIPVIKMNCRQGVATEPPRRSRHVTKLPPEMNKATTFVSHRLGFEEVNLEAAMDNIRSSGPSH